MAVLIPLTTDPNNTFSSTIPVNGKNVTFYFFLRWNAQANYWVMDLSDSSKNPIISSIPLISGINILEQYDYLKIGKAYIVSNDSSSQSDIPDTTNLGTQFVLVWMDND
jgi:hypothetical protein